MYITQVRYLFGENFTLSKLYITERPFSSFWMSSEQLQSSFECYILEDRVREIPGIPVNVWKIDKVTAIPTGTYEVVIDMSTRFKKPMMHLLDVKGFSGIRVHSGNTPLDTEGCLIAGAITYESQGTVGNSRDARDKLSSKIQAALDKNEEVRWRIIGIIPNGADLPFRITDIVGAIQGTSMVL